MVGEVPDLRRDDSRWDAEVVEQRLVAREALLAHEFLAVQRSGVRAELGVALGRDLSDAAIVGHEVSCVRITDRSIR
jgi:hypothetical protein